MLSASLNKTFPSFLPSHTQDNTYHSLCYTSHGSLAGTNNSSMSPPWRIDPTTHHTISEHSYHRATSCSHTNVKSGNLQANQTKHTDHLLFSDQAIKASWCLPVLAVVTLDIWEPKTTRPWSVWMTRSWRLDSRLVPGFTSSVIWKTGCCASSCKQRANQSCKTHTCARTMNTANKDAVNIMWMDISG